MRSPLVEMAGRGLADPGETGGDATSGRRGMIPATSAQRRAGVDRERSTPCRARVYQSICAPNLIKRAVRISVGRSQAAPYPLMEPMTAAELVTL